MIEEAKDIKQLMALNIPIKHLCTLDLNAPDRIFNETAKKIVDMGYVLVHRSDLAEIQEPEENKSDKPTVMEL